MNDTQEARDGARERVRAAHDDSLTARGRLAGARQAAKAVMDGAEARGLEVPGWVAMVLAGAEARADVAYTAAIGEELEAAAGLVAAHRASAVTQ